MSTHSTTLLHRNFGLLVFTSTNLEKEDMGKMLRILEIAAEELEKLHRKLEELNKKLMETAREIGRHA